MRLFGFYSVLSGSVPLHRHPCFEFHYLLTGRGSLQIGQRISPIRRGDFVVIWPEEHHRLIPHQGTKAIGQIYFSGEAGLGDKDLLSDLKKILGDRRVAAVGEWRGLFFDRLRFLSESPKTLSRKSAEHMFIGFLYEILSGKPVPEPFPLLERCIERLHHPVHEKNLIRNIASELSISPEYLIRIFRKRFGVSPLQYLLRMKIQSAEIRLIETKASIGEVAKACGFEDSLYFSRVFKRWKGIPPLAYRERFSK